MTHHVKNYVNCDHTKFSLLTSDGISAAVSAAGSSGIGVVAESCGGRSAVGGLATEAARDGAGVFFFCEKNDLHCEI